MERVKWEVIEAAANLGRRFEFIASFANVDREHFDDIAVDQHIDHCVGLVRASGQDFENRSWVDRDEPSLAVNKGDGECRGI